jgi:2'-5' RNA ligase
MDRLFIALPLDAPTGRSLVSLQRGAVHVDWSPISNLHLTLLFLGEIDGGAVPALIAALSEIRCSPFEIDLQGCGTFDTPGRTALWIGVRGNERLVALRQSLISVVRPFSNVATDEPWRPHVTLGYAAENGRGKAARWVQRVQSFTWRSKAVEECHLYSSNRFSRHVEYRSILKMNLSPAWVADPNFK